jgi:CheY-like chemotaxis protein
MMPVMNGAELYAALSADPALAPVPILYMTAGSSRPPQPAPLFDKPLQINRLLSVLHGLLRDY